MLTAAQGSTNRFDVALACLLGLPRLRDLRDGRRDIAELLQQLRRHQREGLVLGHEDVSATQRDH